MPGVLREIDQAGRSGEETAILEAHPRNEAVDDPTHGESRLPNGSTLYWSQNAVGGRTYLSDEIGGGVEVWDTCLVDQSTLLAAMAKEAELQVIERAAARKASS